VTPKRTRRASRAADVAVVVVGGNESTCREGWSEEHLGDPWRVENGEWRMDLLGRQDELVQAIVETGMPTVVVLINGCPLTINDIAEHVPAILEGWYLGQETGTAVADVLFGDVNPGGKLPITFPRSVGQLPVYYYQKPSAKRGYLFASPEPLFPFGHGLSFTTFAYSNLALAPQEIGVGGKATVSVDVTNTGKMAGEQGSRGAEEQGAATGRDQGGDVRHHAGQAVVPRRAHGTRRRAGPVRHYGGLQLGSIGHRRVAGRGKVAYPVPQTPINKCR
jgi:hypothetical protein